METVAGVFRSRQLARDAAVELRRSGFPADQVSLLYPGSTEEEIHSVPHSDTEQPGVGAAIGGVVGAAVGMAGGFELGVAATALIPGVGPVVAAGIAGAALLGVGGLAAGAELGSRGDVGGTEGIPVRRALLLRGRGTARPLRGHRLRQRRLKEKQRADTVIKDAGAESLDAARETWWVGLRDTEREHYEALGKNFEMDQGAYRQGSRPRFAATAAARQWTTPRIA